MIKNQLLIGGAIVGAALIYVVSKRKPGETMAGTFGREVVTAAGDAAAGAVVGVGSMFGIPATNMTQCQKDLAAGRTWDASFSCPASEFIGGFFPSTGVSAATVTDARQIDRIMERQQQQAPKNLGVYFNPATQQETSFDAMGNVIY